MASWPHAVRPEVDGADVELSLAASGQVGRRRGQDRAVEVAGDPDDERRDECLRCRVVDDAVLVVKRDRQAVLPGDARHRHRDRQRLLADRHGRRCDDIADALRDDKVELICRDPQPRRDVGLLDRWGGEHIGPGRPTVTRRVVGRQCDRRGLRLPVPPIPMGWLRVRRQGSPRPKRRVSVAVDGAAESAAFVVSVIASSWALAASTTLVGAGVALGLALWAFALGAGLAVFAGLAEAAAAGAAAGFGVADGVGVSNRLRRPERPARHQTWRRPRWPGRRARPRHRSDPSGRSPGGPLGVPSDP